MIADLLEANLAAHPERSKLLKGRGGKVRIVATDIGTRVGIALEDGGISVSSEVSDPKVVIETDSSTLLDLPNAKLLMGLPSIADPIGRSVIGKILRRDFRIRGLLSGFALLSKVQRLLSVA
jgi:hypothetical protein